MRMREISPFKMKVMCIETGMVYESANEASRQTGIPQGHISRSCREKQSTARGFHWRYI